MSGNHTPSVMFLVAICLLFPPFGGAAFGSEVVISGFGFEPKNIEISAGETVKWINRGSLAHSITSGADCQKDGQFDSPFLFPEKMKAEKSTFERIFDTPGVYQYFCKTHCKAEKMSGTVTVK